MGLESLFRIQNEKLKLSPKQLEIFEAIVFKRAPRIQVIAPTQYGKSLTVGTAIITRAIGTGEKFTILAPSQKKTDIIMSYVIDHIFDDPVFYNELILENKSELDKLKKLGQHKAKDHVTFKGGGGIQTLTLNAREAKASIEAAMGFGGNRLVLDESSLIDDPVYSTVKRMLGGYKYEDTFLFEIGNPFYRNHFHRTWNSTRYHRIFINYKDALAEGRYSPEFIEEMREEAFFDIFYECKFPDEDALDAKGYRYLLKAEEILAAMTEELADLSQRKYLGVDIGGGGDYNAYVVRTETTAWIEGANKSKDTMTNVGEIERIMEKYSIDPYDVFIDDTGIGRGVSDRLREKDIAINPIAVGASAKDTEKFKNIKAEAFWGLRKWVRKGGKMKRDSRFEELKDIKYKVNSEKLLQIEPKEELRQRTGKSPDFADALMLTFAPPRPRARGFDFKPD